MAQKPLQNLNVPKKGMSRKNPIELDNTEYSFALNANMENSAEDFFSLSNEQSNLLATRFKDGFKFIGGKNDIDSDSTFVFLTNPTTGEGELGEIKSNQNNNDIEDVDGALGKPLETRTQLPLQTYVTLLNDACNKGFNFNINFPIKKIAIKNEKGVKTIYFTDNRNCPRNIEITNLEKYVNTQNLVCGKPSGDFICFNTDNMMVFKKHSIPDLTPVSIDLGGNLTEGTYQFLVAYCDAAGNESSQYYSLTNPIAIFDENNSIQEGLQEASEPTNFAIKVQVEGLDTSYTHYKVAVIQNTNNTQTYFVEGIHTIDDHSVVYTTSKNKIVTTLVNLIKMNASVKKAEGLMVSNDALFLYGLEMEKEWNLQPVVNLMGGFLKWQTSIATESFYEDGINNTKKGYNRDEVYPLSIQFQTNEGYQTPLFPLIGRQATEEDFAEVSTTSKDRLSIEANLTNCGTTGRTKRWQYYNDAKEEGVSYKEGVETTKITESIEKTTFIESVEVIPAGSFSIENVDDYENLKEFVENSIEDCGGHDFCNYLNLANYSNQKEVPEFIGDCSSPELTEEVLLVNKVEGEVITRVSKNFPEEYAKVAAPTICQIYVTDSENLIVRDVEFQTTYTNGGRIYKREFPFSNTGCAYPEELLNLSGTLIPASSQYHTYHGADTPTALQTPKTSAIQAGFTDKIHRGALWYKGTFNANQETILELSRYVDPQPMDDDVSVGSKVRVSIYEKCSSTTPLYTELVDLKLGSQIKLRVFEGQIFVQSNSSTETNAGVFTNTSFLVAVDCPIASTVGGDGITRYKIAPTDGCFSVVTRDIQYERIDVTYDSITLDKKQTYTASCDFRVPKVKNCVALPYKKGSFAYVESTEAYPDNAELYNSQVLEIKASDLGSPEARITFEKQFTQGYLDGKYILKDTADFRCEKIRHFKFPDNKVAPFMWENPLAGFAPTTIFPLGVTIDEKVIIAFLNIAVKNKLITQDQRKSIVSYEIFRGDRTSNKSVEASGYLYDMRTYKEDSKDKLYPNYPYNDLGADKLNLFEDKSDRKKLKKIPHNSDSNFNFTFHSPETDFKKTTVPSELKVEGYIFGKSSGTFVDVHDHPKWVILGKKAKTVATTLAVLESATEIAIQAAHAASRITIPSVGVGSTGGGSSPTAWAASVVIAGLGILNGLVSSVGKYRYEWLKTFRDLGSPKNFAYKYSSTGHYNYLQTLQEEDNLVRGINIGKNLKSGNYTTTNEITGQKLEINNLDREHSTFISLGEDFPLVWETTYKRYDNGTTNASLSSLTYASESKSNVEGRSVDIIKNIASPYVKLKNYVPSQYGALGSISWVNTGYRGDLKNPSLDDISIFGGDTFITRYYLKRKMPLFVTDAMGIASLTPFDYKKYANIGTEPKFYANYELGGEYSRKGFLFPDFDSEYNFDSLTGAREMYVKPPSKFYLYYYGIPGILTETEYNTNYRTGKKEPENDFYPNVGDHTDWTQENLVSIKRPNQFFYNKVYSQSPTQLSYKLQPNTYNKADAEKESKLPNGVRYSLKDGAESGYSDPWLTFRANDFYEFPTSYGKLKELRGIENDVVLGRFENTVAYFNTTDVSVEGMFQNDGAFGNGGVFSKNKPKTFAQTELGFGGTQSSESVSSEYGHFHVDAQRGQVMQTSTGKAPVEISGYESNMRNWFKEHLPFKILKSGISGIDTDNAYNGIGLTMGWDSRFNRVFLTKKDYVVINKECLKYEEGVGFYTDCGDMAETCDEGYTYNETTGKCEKTGVELKLCPEGYTYSDVDNTCTRIVTVEATCSCSADVFANGQTICSGGEVNISLTSTKPGITFNWTVVQNGVAGAIAGTGNLIKQVLNNSGTAIYTVTPTETETNCVGAPLEVTVIVKEIPNVIATPVSWTIDEGETATIALTSSSVGTTFSWTATSVGTTGATSGRGNTISQRITGVGTVTYRITPSLNGCEGVPVDVVINTASIAVLSISNDTQINIWFDDSGSMTSTLSPLRSMSSTILKPCLLPAYNNDSSLYDSRVKVLTFSQAGAAERHIKLLGKTSTTPGVSRVINLVFADESSPYGEDLNSSGVILTTTATDISDLRSTLSTQPANSVLGIIFQVATNDAVYGPFPAFRAFVNNMHTGVAPFTGTSGLSGLPELGYKLDVVPGASPNYYTNLIITALNNLGFTLTAC